MRIPFFLITVLVLSLQFNASPVGGSKKMTNIRFYLHNTHKVNDPSSVLVAENTNATAHARGLVPFSSIYVFDDVLTKGPTSRSKVVGNAQGMYVETGKDGYTILLTIDCEMTDGPFKGSSFVMFSRNEFRKPIREVPVIGGRGAFRMAKGYGLLKTVCVDCINSVNPSKGDIIEYNVTLYLH
ncbi:hypothetical protein ACQJBY_025962 [Aegilops geniculata]